MALYSEKVMDHFENPRNVGKMPDADGIGEVGNAKCGDIMRMYIKVRDDVITDVKFNTFGCGSAIASSSMATEMIKGKPVSEALELSNKAVIEALDGLPAQKIHCSVLAEEAVKAAVKDYYDKMVSPMTPISFRRMTAPPATAAEATKLLFSFFPLLCFCGKHPTVWPGAFCLSAEKSPGRSAEACREDGVSNRCCFALALVGSGCRTPCRARRRT